MSAWQSVRYPSFLNPGHAIPGTKVQGIQDPSGSVGAQSRKAQGIVGAQSRQAQGLVEADHARVEQRRQIRLDGGTGQDQLADRRVRTVPAILYRRAAEVLGQRLRVRGFAAALRPVDDDHQVPPKGKNRPQACPGLRPENAGTIPAEETSESAQRGGFAVLQPTGARGDSCNPERLGALFMRPLALRAVARQTHRA